MSNSSRKSFLSSTTLDRASFIVGLSATLLAFYPLKDSLDNSIITIFGWGLSLYSAGLIFLGLLLSSAYLYGLNNIRYSISAILEWEFSRYLEVIALTVYVVAFLFPLLILILWIVSNILNFISTNLENNIAALNWLSAIITALTALFGTTFSSSLYKNKRELIIDELLNKRARSEIKTENAYDSGDFRMSLLSLFQALMSGLKANLTLRIGIEAQNLSDYQLIRIAKDKNILKPQEIAVIEDLRGIRNKIAHDVDSVNLTQKNMIELRDRIKPILARLQRDRLITIISHRN